MNNNTDKSVEEHRTQILEACGVGHFLSICQFFDRCRIVMHSNED